MDLHGRIMNIPIDRDKERWSIEESIAKHDLTNDIYEAIYRRGHFDALHAAAELVAECRDDIIAEYEEPLRVYETEVGLES